MITITVNGKAYYACLDPNATGVPGEEGWPTPTFRRVGRGVQAVYEVTPEQAKEMSKWVREYGDLISMDGVDDDLAEGRACYKAAESILAQMSKAGVT